MARPTLRNRHRTQVLELLRKGGANRDTLLALLGQSERTLARLIRDLRDDGHEVIVVRRPSGWTYRLDGGDA